MIKMVILYGKEIIDFNIQMTIQKISPSYPEIPLLFFILLLLPFIKMRVNPDAPKYFFKSKACELRMRMWKTERTKIT